MVRAMQQNLGWCWWIAAVCTVAIGCGGGGGRGGGGGGGGGDHGGYTSCGGVTCQPGQYCMDARFATCQRGCTSEVNCTSNQHCEMDGSGDFGAGQCLNDGPSGGVDGGPGTQPAADCIAICDHLIACAPAGSGYDRNTCLANCPALPSTCRQCLGNAGASCDLLNTCASQCPH